MRVRDIPRSDEPFTSSSSLVVVAAAAAAVYSSPPSKMKPWEIGFEADHLEEAVYGFPSGRYFKKVDQCLLALFFSRCGWSLKQKYTTSWA
mmetsp:Transcript_30712/g.45101  ORF Transcript_30712/g.45101 Transcript_30712/m.45101 type:complete len:91 (+) Transcript_30712:443-715(+)